MNKLDELYSFVAADYYATGEGRTISLLITRAYPRKEDYEVEPEWIFTEGKSQYNPGVLKHGPGFRALREFAEVFDGFIARGAQLLTAETFKKDFGKYLPEVFINMLEHPDRPGNLHWHSQLHFNFG